MNIYEKLLQASQVTGVPTKKVLDMFYLLSSGDPVDNNKLLQSVGVSRNALNQVKESLSGLLVPPSKTTQLTPSIVPEVKKLFDGDYNQEESIWEFLRNSDSVQFEDLLNKYSNERPTPNRDYDQFTATVETTARRASLMSFNSDIEGKRILFFGDDDFTSIAVAKRNGAKRIVVVDIDTRILDKIKMIANNESLEIEAIQYNARDPLPNKLKNMFDVIFTDPPYTVQGIELFVSRSVDALDRKNLSSRLYVCYGNSDRAKDRFVQIFDIFRTSGLLVRWVFDKFNRYHGAESIGSASTLYVCDVTSKTKPVITNTYAKPLYTNN